MKTHKWKFEFHDGSVAIEEYPVESAEEAVNIKCGTNTVGLARCTLIDADEPPDGTVDVQPPANEDSIVGHGDGGPNDPTAGAASTDPTVTTPGPEAA